MNDTARDIDAQQNHEAKLLALLVLNNHRWLSMDEVREAGGWRYGARLYALRKKGYPIERRRVGANSWEYRLMERETASPPTTSVRVTTEERQNWAQTELWRQTKGKERYR